MDLRSDYPYSLLRQGIINSYPSLQDDVECDVAVMGAGITGALVSYELCGAGFDVINVDRRHVGMGSTAASTGMLQYEIDTPLRKLIRMVGENNAVRAYQLCEQSIHDITGICKQLDCDSGFRSSPSFQYAGRKNHLKGLKKEYEIRKKSGFQVEWMDAKDIADKYGFHAPGGLFSSTGAQIDAYSFTHALFEKHSGSNLRVFDHTEIRKIDHGKKEIILSSNDGKKIKCKYLVIACGYESHHYLKKKYETFHSTYAIVSEPMKQTEFWHENSLIWETSDPYIYLRTTHDNRILIGGADEKFSNAKRRDSILRKKAKDLESAFNDLFPKISFKTDFKWAGTFAKTKDGLPFIGSVPYLSNTFFALGYGGNGITFSLIAAQIIRDKLKGKANADEKIFSFERKSN